MIGSLGLNFFQNLRIDFIREGVTDGLFILDLEMLLFILVAIHMEVRQNGWKEMYGRFGFRLAIAVGVHTLGLMLMRAWSGWLLYAQRHGQDVGRVQDQYYAALIGALLCFIGMACTIRLCAPRWLGNWSWGLSFLLAAGFTSLMLYL